MPVVICPVCSMYHTCACTSPSFAAVEPMCIRITLESGCCCHIQLPAGQGDKGSRKDGYVVELAILMCELLANASRIQNCNQEEQLVIIGPTLICKNHVINHTTYAHDTYTDTDTGTCIIHMYIHAYVRIVHTGFWEFNAAYLKGWSKESVPKDQDGKRITDRPKPSDM